MKYIKYLLIYSALILFTTDLLAQQSQWEFSIGGGIYGEYVYVGSDDYYVAPLPHFKASYRAGNMTYSISVLEGIGFSYMNSSIGLIAGLQVNSGQTRDSKEYSALGFPVNHSQKTRDFLEGSPDMNSPISAEGSLFYLTPVGLMGVSATYSPISIEYNQNELGDETRHGILLSAIYAIGVPVSQKFSVTAILTLDYMDQGYADSWYTVDRPTDTLQSFEANAGFRDFMVAGELTYQVTEKLDLVIMGISTTLLNDADKSPFTVEKVQRQMMTQIVYHF